MTNHRAWISLCVFSLCSLCVCGSFSSAAAPLQSLAVFPPDVRLLTARDRQSFVVQATYADGITRDVTGEATAALSNPALAKLVGNVLTPAADGTCEMTVTFDGQIVQVPLTVKDASADRPISFKRDVMPVFMRAACNQGSCHGA